MRTTPPPSVAIIGLGMWGKQLVRVATEAGLIIHAYDQHAAAAQLLSQKYPDIRIRRSLKSILSDPDIAAVIVATPPPTHYRIASQSLRAGKHVLIEKPMTLSVRDASRLIRLSHRTHPIIMVDHTYVFSPALRAAKRLIDRKKIGTLTHIENTRAGSRVRPDSTILWDFAPHDVSISQYLFNRAPLWVRTIAPPYRKGMLLPRASIELSFPQAISYLAHLSWENPVKERRLTIVGSDKSLTIHWHGKRESLVLHDSSGKTTIPTPDKEPLQEMIRHFVHCITRHEQPVSDQYAGLTSVRTIQALHTSWKRNGAKITL